MSLSTFSFPSTVLYEPGMIERLPAELERLDMRKPLLVTDGGLAHTPVFDTIRRLIPNEPVFSGVEPNPTEKNVLD